MKQNTNSNSQTQHEAASPFHDLSLGRQAPEGCESPPADPVTSPFQAQSARRAQQLRARRSLLDAQSARTTAIGGDFAGIWSSSKTSKVFLFPLLYLHLMLDDVSYIVGIFGNHMSPASP